MQYFEVLQTIERSGGDARLAVSPEWMQGGAVFGGLQAATDAARDARPGASGSAGAHPAGDLCGAACATQLLARASVLRQGKSATHVECRLLDGDNVLATATAVFGAARESRVTRVPEQPAVPCDKPRTFKYFPGLSPTFTQYFAARWLQGGMPFTGPAEPQCVVDVSMPGEQASSESHVIALADFIPPIALSYLSMPVPGSSMTWMLEFLTEDLNGLSMQNWRVDAEMVAGAHGYTSQSVMLWGPDGQPIALSRQNMVVFG
ncbi:MAG: thioesterase family protein [Gammaproteobacteria bacterium]